MSNQITGKELPDHIFDQIWEEGADVGRNTFMYSERLRGPCPYAQNTREWEAWWLGFDHAFFLGNT